ncbi:MULTISPECIES: type II secretion system F family protein [Vibrio]|uniref:type II secretion system F family protein n=1 Tax=Vibrio TaxID=662 RepID=UPI002076289C|nr:MULTISPECIES: type II secretion system F family protein [Vibrio]USD34894.1 type II secretion system F family protein [Vibrio sp. SCSIO 43186]USD47959.1 type II secretion system F family protein [Vibrio sp. SCSIO 43145]USD72018.1 type II secretion system F family protein [Vibrio sp. SCSIO 43139]USD97687.1 pilus assembly protein [Vibrio coralliilyticus]
MISMIATLLIVVGVISSVVCFQLARQQDVIHRRLKQVSISTLHTRSLGEKWRWKSNPARQKQLALIGFSQNHAETQFVLIRFVLMLCGAGLWHFSRSLGWSAVDIAQDIAVAIACGIAVDRLLEWRVNQVRQEISKVAPDALDLMVVCVASGLTLENTFRVVGEEMTSVSPALAREWALTATEMSVLDSPQQALLNLDQRLELPDINNMVVTMSQALQFGTPLSQALSLIASDSRQYQLLALEEWVGKIPAKMSFPLVVFIMLPVVVMIVAPVVLSLFNTLDTL